MASANGKVSLLTTFVSASSPESRGGNLKSRIIPSLWPGGAPLSPGRSFYPGSCQPTELVDAAKAPDTQDGDTNPSLRLGKQLQLACQLAVIADKAPSVARHLQKRTQWNNLRRTREMRLDRHRIGQTLQQIAALRRR